MSKATTEVETRRISRVEDTTGPVQSFGALDPTPMIGRWANTNPRTDGIVETAIARDESRMMVHVTGKGGTGPIAWGWADAKVYGCIEEDGNPATVLYAHYDFGFMEAHLQIRLNRGVLVVANFNVFKDDSGRSNYFNREFFSL
jgi:hypothetical protein